MSNKFTDRQLVNSHQTWILGQFHTQFNTVFVGMQQSYKMKYFYNFEPAFLRCYASTVEQCSFYTVCCFT